MSRASGASGVDAEVPAVRFDGGGAAADARPPVPVPDDGVVPSPSYVRTRVVFGSGSLERIRPLLADAVERHRPRRILLLTGRRMASKPWQQVVADAVASYRHVAIENGRANPTFRSVERILLEARAQGVDLVVALGGGSVLDAAKVVALLVRGEIDVRSAVQFGLGTPAPEAVPILAIPTTSGSGSEVTATATVWDDTERRKHSLAHPTMMPELAIVDPGVTPTLPPHFVASTGLDALAQAVEASWSVKASEESIGFALRAVPLLAEHLEAVLRHPHDLTLRAQVSLASLYAGMAIAQASTTLSHAISYPLTAHYGLSHGYACGLTLGALVRFNAGVAGDTCRDRRGPAHVLGTLAEICGALGVRDGESAEAEVNRLIRALGLKTFDERAELDVSLIVREVLSYDRIQNNPRTVDGEGLRDFLESLRRPAPGVATVDAP